MRKKKALLIISALVLCLALRELGVIDASFYRSALSSTRSQGKTSTRPPGAEKDEDTSYRLTIKHHGQELHSYSYSYSNNNQPPIEIEATLEEPIYTGNDALPLSKNFKMTYRCRFTTLPSPGEWSLSGEIEGEVTAKILGFCSRRKARELAFEEAKKQIISSLKNRPIF